MKDIIFFKICSMHVSIKSLLCAFVACLSLTACHEKMDGVRYYNNSVEVCFVDSEGNNLLNSLNKDGSMLFDDLQLYKSCSPDFEESRIDISIGFWGSATGGYLLEKGPYTVREGFFVPVPSVFCYPLGAFVPLYDNSANVSYTTDGYPIIEYFDFGLMFGFSNDAPESKSERIVKLRVYWPKGNREWNFELRYGRDYSNARFYADGELIDCEKVHKIVVD